MPAAHQTPCFNLKAVVQQTGLKRDTLRAWERRYGLPKPKRSEGGHRLYSGRDIRIIKWLVARQREGLSIRRAVELWRNMEAEGLDPLGTAALVPPQVAVPSAGQTTGSAIAKLRDDWVAACLAFNEQGAEQVLAQAFALYSPETVCLELLQKGVAQIGQGCYQDEVTVQQEHFASALAMRRLEALILTTPAPTRPGRILVGGPPDEEHTFGLLLLSFLLRRQGWEVLYLGASVPLARMRATIIAAQSQLVILAAQRLHTAATLFDMAQLLGQERVPVAFGGMVFNLVPALRDRIPGHFLGERLENAPQVVGRLMVTPLLHPPVEPVLETCHQASGHYRERQAHIEVRLGQVLRPTGIAHEYLNKANTELGRNILAALTLGDMDFLGTDIDWLECLLRDYTAPADSLHSYLHAYYRAAKEHLDERGQLIVDWLAELIDHNVKHK
jgi:DNA-binding transcriptional MerR regulator/methylmalonyl-CoA mutase cobalamin-binding subunit